MLDNLPGGGGGGGGGELITCLGGSISFLLYTVANDVVLSIIY